MFNYQNNVLFAEQCSISHIVKTIPSPFYCYSTQAIIDQINKFQQAVAPFSHTVCYAVKANSNQAILSIMATQGMGADVVSVGELTRALSAGISASNIVFSGVGKKSQEIAAALTAGIFQFNVESEPELIQISQVASKLHKTANIAFRINPDVDAKTHAKISTGKAENKFGIPLNRARDVYQWASQQANIKIQGVDVHIGSQLTELAPYKQAFTIVSELVTQLRNDGHNITVIDVGGGLGVSYQDNIDEPNITQYAAIVEQTLGHLNCHIIFEPGRYLMANAGVLVSQTLYEKHGESCRFLILDAAMNDLLRPSLYDAWHEVVPITIDEQRDKIAYDIVGPVCETGDTFAKGRQLQQTNAGEYVAIKSAGAYGAVMSSTYNTRPLIAEVLVHQDKVEIIRAPVTEESLIALDTVPNWLT